jgi:hypothetical protein
MRELYAPFAKGAPTRQRRTRAVRNFGPDGELDSATRIFMNEVATVCELVGADYVRRAIGS